MRDRLAFALSAAVFLFLAEALRAFFGVLFAGFYDALFPHFDAVALVAGLIPLVALLPPILPLLRWIERDRLVAGSAAAAALLRIGLCFPGFTPRALFASAVIACSASFIMAATGSFSRRIYAAGAVTGLVLDQVFRLAGRSYDLTLRPQWVPAQLAIASLVLLAAFRFQATPESDDANDQEERLERRTGGLRLRGSIILGCILFLETSFIGMPEVASRLAGVAYHQVGLVLIVSGAAAVAVLLASAGPFGRERPVAIALASLVIVAVMLPFMLTGWLAALLLAAAHFALLVLLYRALAPAGGRRGGWVTTIGLAVVVVFQLLYGFTFFYGFTLSGFRGRAPLILAAAGALVLTGLLFLPRPSTSRARWHRVPLIATGLILLTLGLRLTWQAWPRPIVATAASTFRITTFNVRYGFDNEWRYDPERIARALEASAADVIVLQEVPAGVPAAYGTDLALWLGRRLRMQSIFAPSINGLLGDAFLTRLPIVAFNSQLLPPDTTDRKQLGRLTVRAGRSLVTVFGTHFGVHEHERRAQVNAVQALMQQTTPAVLAGDLNALPSSAVLSQLGDSGLRSVFEVLGLTNPPTAPALQPTETIDYILVRGLTVESAEVLRTTASDHRPVRATLRVQ